ncbi:hypothetical protein HID58_020896 [Brassica napus]|uniref:NYN domain-containing protein n=1 Tax=Brassica napus TaxID=3708 RepID=A0ABQ8CUY6_BRANA|nr:uncharacterized protein LOC111198795 [Brassica napus]KAH0920878.1 hypothetical protein HID58_020896 [Brassica napus]
MTPHNFVDRSCDYALSVLLITADAPTAVFWDADGCPVPADLDFISVLRNIKRCLCESSYNGTVYDSSSPCLIDEKPPVENLVITRFPEGGDPFEKFKKIFVDIMDWSIDNPVPANILYISGGDMNPYMIRLINQLNGDCYNMLLCLADSLTDFPFISSVWSWSELSHGLSPTGFPM